MKKSRLLPAVVLLAALCFRIGFAEDVWRCDACGFDSNSGKFCQECGARRPEDSGEWTCSRCGAVSAGNFCPECGNPREEQPADGTAGVFEIPVTVRFAKNRVLATYDVDMYLDGQLITALKHGVDYMTVLPMTAGSHTFMFYEHGLRDVYGSALVSIEGASALELSIHAKSLTIEAEAVRISAGAEDGREDTGRDGALTLNIKCEKNDFFSRYDILVYVDKEYIGRILHGKSMNETVSLDQGGHTVTFCSAEDSAVSNTVDVEVSQASSVQCELHCRRNKITVNKLKITP